MSKTNTAKLSRRMNTILDVVAQAFNAKDGWVHVVSTHSTAEALEARGLVVTRTEGILTYAKVTEAGRAALCSSDAA